MAVREFVKQRFGQKLAEKLARIRTGGDSNAKGTEFENFYAAAKVCELVAKHPDHISDYLLSAQEEAFVDDLCLRQITASVKVNYQAKNSSGAAASWTEDIENRFRMQAVIDTNLHAYQSSRQVLLVSCHVKAAANSSAIPWDLKESCHSEFFPYDKKPTSIIYLSQELRQNLEIICDSANLATLDVAYRCVLAAWTSGDGVRSISDIIGEAKRISRPDVFSSLIQVNPDVPHWLLQLCSTFQGLDARVESGRFVVSYNGFEVSVGVSRPEPEPAVLESFGDVTQVLMYLMAEAQQELNDA